MKRTRPNMKQQLKKRTENSYKTKNSGSKIGILNVPDGRSFLELKDKKRYKIDILPFSIVTNNYPNQEVYKEENPCHYKLDVWVHRYIGFAEGHYVCLRKNYNKPCPICEEYDFLKKQGDVDDDVLGNLKPKRRVIYNVYNHEEEKLQLFSTSHHLFEKELLDEAFSPTDGEMLTFSDPEEGCHIKFRASEVSIGSFKFFEFKSFSFIEREYPISDEILDNVISLDEILIIPSYEEVKAALHGIDDEIETEKDNKQKRKKTTVIKDEEEDVEEEDIDEEDVDEEDVDEEDIPKKERNKKRKITKKNKCPNNYKFGEDCEEYEECDDCSVWEECSEYVD